MRTFDPELSVTNGRLRVAQSDFEQLGIVPNVYLTWRKQCSPPRFQREVWDKIGKFAMQVIGVHGLEEIAGSGVLAAPDVPA